MASSSGCVRRADDSSCPGAGARDALASPSETPRPDHRFPPQSRLTSRRQFQAVYERGRRAASSSFVMFGMLNAVGFSRLGLTVTRKVGHAVIRTRAKRRLREVFRRHRHGLAPACDLVINVRPALLDRPFEQLEREFLACFARLAVAIERSPERGERSTS